MSATIPLTRGLTAIVDDEDAARLTGHRWCAVRITGRWYAKRGVWDARSERVRTVYLHRAAVEAQADARVIPLDGDGLNCRRANLAVVGPATGGRRDRPARVAS